MTFHIISLCKTSLQTDENTILKSFSAENMLTVKSDERTGDYRFASAELSTVFSLGPGPYLLNLMLNARPVYLI